MSTNYSFPFQTNIMYAIDRHNDIMPKERMTLLDGAILSLIKSFSERNQQFYMSNKEMKKIFASDPGTIQRSIDRLVAMGLIEKNKEYINQRPRRYLTYKPDAVNKFIQWTV